MLATMQELYRSHDSAFANIWKATQDTDLVCPSKPNPDLLTGDALKKIDLSPAADYFKHQDKRNFIRVRTAAFDVVAVQNASAEDVLPAERAIAEQLAIQGAHMLFAGGTTLRKQLFEAGILYVTSQGSTAASMTQFKAVFEDIAYVVLRPHPTSWGMFDDKARSFAKHTHTNFSFLNRVCICVLRNPQEAMCTCHVFGIQQQCQHSFFVEGLDFQDGPLPARNFREIPLARTPGRPKGKAKAKAMRAA